MNGNVYMNSNDNNRRNKENFKANKKEKYGNTVNGFNANMNKYAKNLNKEANSVANSIQKAKLKGRKEAAKKAISTGLTAVAPPLGVAADQALKTEKGDKLVEEYVKADSPTKGLNNVIRKLKEEQQKVKFVLVALIFFIPVLVMIFLLVLIFKNADTQIYSNENGGTTGEYVPNDPYDSSVFSDYPGLYEKVENSVSKISNKYKVEVDKYLILATLIAPIENGLIMPVNDGSCGANECYYLEGKSYTWEEFIDLWGDQAEYLAKAQILTYINVSSDIKVDCGSEDTMEQYAKNDLEVNEFNFWALFNPLNWFKGFRDVTDAELNAKCIMDVPVGKSKIPTVRVISKGRGTYYNSVNANHEHEFEKDPNSGGVYFWNLVNEGGFIHVYMKDYLNVDPNASDEQNYEVNLPTIVDTANYIYSYYESIRKDCNGYNLIETSIDTITVTDGTRPGGVIDFEDQYIGGVMLAEYNSGNMESLKAFAILARSYALSVVGPDGSGTIENSSNNQNYNPDYSPEKYPRIAEAVEATRGLVVVDFGKTTAKMTEYDAFCPVKNVMEDGFYYLPDGQKNLPINPGAYEAKTGSPFTISEEYLKCPCFQSAKDRPYDEKIDGKDIRFHTSPNSPPTHAGGRPPQETLDECWTATSHTRTNLLMQTEYGWAYKPTGGHGRGASQHGLKYFGAFEYEWEALIKMFYGDAVAIKRITSSLEDGECQNGLISGGTGACGVEFEVTDSNYTKTISGSPLNAPLSEVLTENSYSLDCLNGCINARVSSASGNREAVVEAGVGLLECTMEMTGGFTYPYDHRGGPISYMGTDTGINPLWGEYTDYATGCNSSKCRLGLNCANFVRWSMCNGGMSELCSKGSTFAKAMAGAYEGDPDYFPGAIRIRFTSGGFTSRPNASISELSSNYKSILGKSSGSINSLSVDEILSLIQPGDVLYSDRNGGSNHVMLVTGVEDDAIWIGENGRKTRRISHRELTSNSMTYIVLLLDGFYGN